MSSFKNVPLSDFSVESERIAIKNAIKELQAKLAKGPFAVSALGCVTSKDNNIDFSDLNTAVVSTPEDLTLNFSSTQEVNKLVCDAALTKLISTKDSWAETEIEVRAKVLEKAADIMQKRRHELSAIMVLEAGKPWNEADADLAEAIDFCRYYALEARRLFQIKKMGDLQGENNLYFYEPRGITVVISPWNFPLAIPCGMFSASLVTGNCTILKPAEQSPVIARILFEIFLEAGLPNNVAAFLPGKGEDIGDYLCRDKRVSTVVFTGSKEVGLSLVEIGGRTLRGQTHVKKVIAEMGGKNAIVVDSDADIDEAIKGVLHSAYGFQGQKCSACSRVYIVSSDTFNVFTARFSEAVQDLKIGPSSDPSSFAGPVISQESCSRINNIIDITKKEHPIFVQSKIDDSLKNKGYYVSPTAFINVPEDHEVMRNEIFGPVVVINKVRTFQEGIKFAIDSEYRLTGGIYSRSPANIEYAIKNFKVGNLYINRPCTGALVYRQPFGGAHMSGVGSKAGGPDYLLQFVIPRAVSENTMRRGFAPE